MYNYNYKTGEEVVVVFQPEGLATPNLVKKIGTIQRVFDGRVTKDSDMDWFCDIKVDGEIFGWVSLSCILPVNVIEIVPSPRPEDDKTKWPTYHEMLDYLCRELGVPGSPDFHSAVQWVKQDLELLESLRAEFSKAEIARRKRRMG
jgi:hypothetical protein